MSDPADQLRRYSAAVASVVPPTDLDDVAGHRRRAAPRWVLAGAAAALVVIVVGVAVVAINRTDQPTDLTTDPQGSAQPDLHGPGTWDTFVPAPIEGRSGATAVASPDEMLIWGGENLAPFNDGAAYSFTAGTWRTLAPSPLSARERAISVWTGREMLIWGGADDSALLADGAAYDPSTDSWQALPGPSAGLPFLGAIDGNTGVTWTGNELVLVGGPDASGDLQDWVAVLDPEVGWRTLTAIAPPEGGGEPRERSAFWTGAEVLVVTVTDLEAVTVDRLNLADGTWGERIVTEAPGLDTSADAAALVEDRLVVAGHYEPGAIVDLETGTARSLAPSNSGVRFPALVVGTAVTHGDRWLDLADEEWEDAAPVPDPHGEFPVAVTDGKRAYYWGGSACGPAASCSGIVDPEIGLIWTPPSPEASPSTTTSTTTPPPGRLVIELIDPPLYIEGWDMAVRITPDGGATVERRAEDFSTEDGGPQGLGTSVSLTVDVPAGPVGVQAHLTIGQGPGPREPDFIDQFDGSLCSAVTVEVPPAGVATAEMDWRTGCLESADAPLPAASDLLPTRPPDATGVLVGPYPGDAVPTQYLTVSSGEPESFDHAALELTEAVVIDGDDGEEIDASALVGGTRVEIWFAGCDGSDPPGCTVQALRTRP